MKLPLHMPSSTYLLLLLLLCRIECPILSWWAIIIYAFVLMFFLLQVERKQKTAHLIANYMYLCVSRGGLVFDNKTA